MSLNRRGWILVSVVLLMIVAGELAVRFGSPPKVCVRITNGEDAPMEDLVVEHDGTRVPLGLIPGRGSTTVWLTSRRMGNLKLAFRQKPNPLASVEIEEFDPPSLLRDGFMQMLTIRSGEVARAIEDDDSSTALGRLGERLRNWLDAELSLVR